MKQHGKLLWTDAQNSKSLKDQAYFQWIEDTYIKEFCVCAGKAFYQNYGLENGSFPQGLLRFWLPI
jgi:hypothetical protein